MQSQFFYLVLCHQAVQAQTQREISHLDERVLQVKDVNIWANHSIGLTESFVAHVLGLHTKQTAADICEVFRTPCSHEF